MQFASILSRRPLPSSHNLIYRAAMGNALSCKDRELLDLEDVELPHSDPDRNTGVRLLHPIGKGGICTVFLAEHHPTRGSGVIRRDAPLRLAIKILQPGVLHRFRRLNLDARTTVRREWLALNRVMDRPIPTELVVGVYGNGDTNIDVNGAPRELPWLALEYVDGGSEGTTLAQRVQRTKQRDGGIDPVRALRLTERLSQGVQILHELDIVHKDLKPDNIFVSGPIDNETPKIGDCGIASVPGVASTVYGVMTQQYGGPEQTLSASFPTRQNPVLGPWTDVHALSALIWYLITGEDWYRGEHDSGWVRGERRSLLQGAQLHEGFQRNAPLLEGVDEVLRRGAAFRPPDEAWQREGAAPYRAFVEKERPELLKGTQRYASVNEFTRALLPLLNEAADSWRRFANSAQRNATVFRSTRVLDAEGMSACRVIHSSAVYSERLPEPIAPEQLALQIDGRMLAKSGPRLIHLLDLERSTDIEVPSEFAQHVTNLRFVTRGPRDGYALWSSNAIVLLGDNGFQTLALPGGVSGEVEAVLGDGRAFALSTGGELWQWRANAWDPEVIDLRLARADRIVSGPDGLLVVLGVGLRQQKPEVVLVHNNGVNCPRIPACGGLRRAVCGIGQTWIAADPGTVLRIAQDGVTVQIVDSTEEAVDLQLDPVGIPWLVTTRSVFRLLGSRWLQCHRSTVETDPFIAIGFTPAGARLISARGHVTVLEPSDVGEWRRG